jgi:hypothetical protein
MKLSFEKLENKITLSSINLSLPNVHNQPEKQEVYHLQQKHIKETKFSSQLHNCLWKEHGNYFQNNYNIQNPNQSQIIINKSGQIINYIPPTPTRPFPLFIEIKFPDRPIGRPINPSIQINPPIHIK